MVIFACKTGMRQREIVSVHLKCVEYHSDVSELWLPPEITKTNEGRMVLLNPEAKEAYLRLRESSVGSSPTVAYTTAGGTPRRHWAIPKVGEVTRTSGSSSTPVVTLRRRRWRS